MACFETCPPAGAGGRRNCEKKRRIKMIAAKDLRYSRCSRDEKFPIGTASALREKRKRFGSESQTSYEYENPPNLPIPHKGTGISWLRVPAVPRAFTSLIAFFFFP